MRCAWVSAAFFKNFGISAGIMLTVAIHKEKKSKTLALPYPDPVLIAAPLPKFSE